MVKIAGTQKQDGGGFGLGSLLGKVAGGIGGFMIGGPAGAMTGAQLGGSLGGAAGGMIKPGDNKDRGVEVKGAVDSGFQAPKPQPSAIDRLNSIADLGTTVYGGVQGVQNLMKAPSIGASASAIDRRLSNFNKMNAGY